MTRTRVVPRGELAYQPDGPTRGWAHIGWTDHAESAPGHLDFDPLVLVAESEMRPGESVPMHRHENIENITVMRRGRCRHDDSAGNHKTLECDDVLVMSAGAGIEHAERVIGDEPLRALVIWIRPKEPNGSPSLSACTRPRSQRQDRIALLASGRGDDGAARIGNDVTIHGAVLSPGALVTHEVRPGRRCYAIALDGPVLTNGAQASAGDRILVEGPCSFQLQGVAQSEVVLVDLPSE